MLSTKTLGASTLLALATSGIACVSGEDVTVGEQSGINTALYPKSLECVPGDPYEPEVDWEGYVENSSSVYANQRVRIRVPDESSPGFVVFGSGPRLPEATDPDEGYPCPDMAGDFVLPGFPYTMENAFVTDFRMQFRIAAYEPMDSWCALREASATYPERPAGCEPPEDSENPAINDVVWGLCQYCACDSAGCHSKSAEEPVSAYNDGVYYTFDIGIDDDRADGSVRNLLPDISSSIGMSLQSARFQRVD